MPMLDRGRFNGALVADYSIDVLLRYSCPPRCHAKYAVAVLDDRGRPSAAACCRCPTAWCCAAAATAPRGPDRQHPVLDGGGAVGADVWMLLGTWRHMRRRSQIQGALVQETNFRRAMENSMLTGMRAMDLEGRITYVNPAFCQMTGFTKRRAGRPPAALPLLARRPHRREHRLLQQELQGRSPAGGIEVKVMRKDGTLFDARMYVSPLIDAAATRPAG
jgi:PAS domain S-box-containing protein